MKTKSFFEKLKTLVESTTMESATFPYKTTLSKANVKTNRMGGERYKMDLSQKSSFATKYFTFSKFNLSMRTSYE